jgi:hypothetical protein
MAVLEIHVNICSSMTMSPSSQSQKGDGPERTAVWLDGCPIAPLASVHFNVSVSRWHSVRSLHQPVRVFRTSKVLVTTDILRPAFEFRQMMPTWKGAGS